MFLKLDRNTTGYLKQAQVEKLANWVWSECHPSGALLPSKEKGKLRLEGKDYIVKDGDVLNFRFNT